MNPFVQGEVLPSEVSGLGDSHPLLCQARVFRACGHSRVRDSVSTMSVLPVRTPSLSLSLLPLRGVHATAAPAGRRLRRAISQNTVLGIIL